MGVESGDDVVRGCREQQLVIGERVRHAGAVVDLDRDAGVFLGGERDLRLGLREDPIERGLRRGRIGDRHQDDHGRAAEHLRIRHGRVQRRLRKLEHRHADTPVEPWLDVRRPAEVGATGGDHLVEHRGELAVQGLVQVDSLDLREPAEELPKRGILRLRGLEAHLEVDRRRGGNIARSAADGRDTRAHEERADGDPDADGEGGNDADDERPATRALPLKSGWRSRSPLCSGPAGSGRKRR